MDETSEMENRSLQNNGELHSPVSSFSCLLAAAFKSYTRTTAVQTQAKETASIEYYIIAIAFLKPAEAHPG